MMIGDTVEIIGDDEKGGIVIRPYSMQCAFCGGKDGLIEFGKQWVCGGCVQTIKRIGGGK